MWLLLSLGCLSTQDDYLALRQALLDQDGDGYIWDRFPGEGGTDCDDFNASVHPAATEIPYNGLDDDCCETTPDDDIDGDGFDLAVDCDDADATVYPGAIEIRADGVDQNCDGADPHFWGVSNEDPVSPDLTPPRPEDLGAGAVGGRRGNEEDSGDEGSLYTEVTRYSGRLFDDTNLLQPGDALEAAIWRVEDIDGEPPFKAEPLTREDLTFTGDSMDFTLVFELEAGEVATCEVYIFSEDAGYASSGPVSIEAGDWLADQEITLGEDLQFCDPDAVDQERSIVCGWGYDDTGLMVKGMSFHLRMVSTNDFSGDGWPDYSIVTEIGGADLTWFDSPTEFQANANASFEETEEIRIYIHAELQDGDVDPDLWGKTDPFEWTPGTQIVDINVTFTDVIL